VGVLVAAVDADIVDVDALPEDTLDAALCPFESPFWKSPARWLIASGWLPLRPTPALVAFAALIPGPYGEVGGCIGCGCGYAATEPILDEALSGVKGMLPARDGGPGDVGEGMTRLSRVDWRIPGSGVIPDVLIAPGETAAGAGVDGVGVVPELDVPTADGEPAAELDADGLRLIASADSSWLIVR